MTIGEARRIAAARVGPLDARYLVAWACGIAPSDVVTLRDDPVPEGAETRLMDAIERRVAGWSVAHVTGQAQFWGRRFVVTQDVLTPRPETESLVALALEGPFERVLDLGTGSGCIAVSVLADRPTSKGVATDLSQGALDCARANAALHEVEHRLTMLKTDWWDGFSGQFDLIVSNPPYIAEDEMTELSQEVLREPRMALTPGADGLGAYRAICAGLREHLSPGGRVLLEIGPTQGAAVSAMLRDHGLEDIRVHPDMDGRERVVAGRRPA